MVIYGYTDAAKLEHVAINGLVIIQSNLRSENWVNENGTFQYKCGMLVISLRAEGTGQL